MGNEISVRDQTAPATVKRAAAQAALIRRTVAPGATDDEFNLFMHWSSTLGLDPLKREVYLFVFTKWVDDEDNKDADGKPKKKKIRQPTLVIGIGGYRNIAAKSGDYRPSEDEPEIHLTEEMEERLSELRKARKIEDLAQRKERLALIDEMYPIDLANPEGIDRAVVYCWQYKHGEWNRIAGVAPWKDFAPLRRAWDKAKKAHHGPWFLDTTKEQWSRSPRNQICKCAEAQALRKGWPDKFNNSYEQAELDRVITLEATASELVEADAENRRLEAVGRQGITIPLIAGGPNTDEAIGDLENVPIGKFADRCLAYMDRYKDSPVIVKEWWGRNRIGIREFVSHVQSETPGASGWKEVRARYEEIMSNAQAKAEADKAQGDQS
jgi:phage recombination protein Bet